MSRELETRLLEGELTYTGEQLRPHWIYNHYDILGDAAVAFVGPCRVMLTEMVDLEDVKANAPIYSPRMLHIIAEFFSGDLHLAVYRQRLLIVLAKELLEGRITLPITRRGDDLYIQRGGEAWGKLSVSIATSSGSSQLIHTGFNIETEGTPVPTAGLRELGIEPIPFAATLLDAYAGEVDGIWRARCKVRAVSE